MSEYPPGKKKDKKAREQVHGGFDELKDLLARPKSVPEPVSPAEVPARQEPEQPSVTSAPEVVSVKTAKELDKVITYALQRSLVSSSEETIEKVTGLQARLSVAGASGNVAAIGKAVKEARAFLAENFPNAEEDYYKTFVTEARARQKAESKPKQEEKPQSAALEESMREVEARAAENVPGEELIVGKSLEQLRAEDTEAAPVQTERSAPKTLEEVFGNQPVPEKVRKAYEKAPEKKKPKYLTNLLKALTSQKEREENKRKEEERREQRKRGRREKRKKKESVIPPRETEVSKNERRRDELLQVMEVPSAETAKILDSESERKATEFINSLPVEDQILYSKQYKVLVDGAKRDKKVAEALASVRGAEGANDTAEETPEPGSGGFRAALEAAEARKAVAEESARTGPEEVQEPTPAIEGTPKEWRVKLRDLIESTRDIAEGTSERFAKSKEYLNNRAKEIDAKAETSKAEKIVQRMGELYNKLNWREKLGIGLVFGAGAVVSGGSLPVFVGLLGAQRAFGMASLYLSQQQELQNAKVMESGQIISLKERAAISAVSSGALMGAAIGKAIEWANESGLVERTREWLGGKLGHEAAPAEPGGREGIPPIVTTADHIANPYLRPVPEVPAPSAQGSVPVAPEAPAPAPAAGGEPLISEPPGAMPEITVEAAKGKGYETMMKDMWRGLQELKEQGLDASKYPEGSDIRRLLEANPQSIDKIVHQIATDSSHGFFKPDGTSVQINLGDEMSINDDGYIRLNDMIQAPKGAPVTGVYPPERVAGIRPTVVSPVQGLGGEARLETSQAQQTVAEQSPASGAAPAPAESIEWKSRDGTVWRDGSGNPIQSESFTVQPAPTPEVSVPAEAVSPAAEMPATSLPTETIPVQESLPTVDLTQNQPEQTSVIQNSFGLSIPTAEAHVYADSGGQNVVFGGSPEAKMRVISEYLTQNPDKVVFTSDDTGEYRIPVRLVAGELTADAPVRTSGLLGFFSTFMKAPEPDELAKLIK